MDELVNELRYYSESLLSPETLWVIAIGLATATIVFSVLWTWYRNWQKNDADYQYKKQFESLFTPEFEEVLPEKDDDDSIGARWSRYWHHRMLRAGIKRYGNANKNLAGRDAIVLVLAATVLIFVFSTNIILSILGGMTALILTNMYLGFKAASIEASIDAQVPSFLAGLKANLQANQTPERALLNVIEDLADPLYSELVTTQSELRSGRDLQTVMENLKQRTTSSELKFLCSAIKLAASYGANLEAHIDIIQETLVERQKLSNKLASASKQATPSIVVSSIIIPGLFLFTYFSSPDAQDFWFVTPVSWIAFIFVAGLYGGGVFMSKKMVDNIKKI